MRTLRVAAHAAAAGCVIVLGSGCRPDYPTDPSRNGVVEAPSRVSAGWGNGATVDVKPEVDTLPLGSSVQLTAAVDAAHPARTPLKWSSLDSAVVTVNDDGVATAKNGGTALLVARLGPVADTVSITVAVPVVAVVASPKSGDLAVGEQSQITATPNDALGRPIADATVSWTSSDPSVASVTEAGVVTGVSTGDAKVVASAAGKSDTAQVHVSSVRVTSVELSPASLALSLGAAGQLSAIARSQSGATLSNRLTTWTTSDSSVARVSPTGEVTGAGAGSATITATVDGVTATAAVKVGAATVSSLAVTANATSLTVGQTTQLSAVVRDASGATLSGRTVTWSTSDAAVATVSSSGLVTATGAGSVKVSATSDGVSGSVSLSVTQTAVAAVAVSLNSSSVSVGQTTQATVSATDASGQPIVGRTATFTISPTSVASVSSSGLVTGVSAGSATLTATVDGKSATATVTVLAATSSAPAPTVGSPAALPKAQVDARAATVTGSSIQVSAGQDLQAALDAAKPGDEIVLASGATFVGNFVLRPKTGTGWITVRSAGTLPAAGTRVTPGAAAGFAKIQTPNVGPALATAAGAAYWRLLGVDVGPSPAAGLVYSLITLGDASTAQTSLSQVPHHLVLDRVYVHGTSTFNLRRCVALNSAWSAVVDSYIDNCHSNDGDSQAIHGSNGPGPYLIENNYLAGAAENIMFGGDDPRSSELVPSDITIRGNDVVTPQSWKGVWAKKNLLELKLGRRVLVERNVFDGSWTSAQTGYAIVLWSVNQGGSAPWSETSDLTLRHNVIRNTEAGFQLSDKYYATSSVRMSRLLIQDNDLTGVQGRAVTAENVDDLTIDHNTLTTGLIFNSGVHYRLVFTANAIHVPTCPADWGFCGSMFRSADGHDGDAATILGYHAPGATVLGNLIDGDRVSASRTPASNGAPASDAGARP